MLSNFLQLCDDLVRFLLETIIRFVMFNKIRALGIAGVILAMIFVPGLVTSILSGFGTAGSGILFMIGSIGNLVLIVVELLGTLIVALFSAIVLFISWILTFVIYPLMTIAVILTIPATALVIAGVFSCPDEKSFLPWLDALMSQSFEPSMSGSGPQISSFMGPQSGSIWTNLRDRYMNLVARKLIIKSMRVRYLHLGFCRLAFCTANSGPNSWKGDDNLYVGVFNTWLPLK